MTRWRGDGQMDASRQAGAWPRIAGCLLLLALVAAVYGQGGGHLFLHFDDFNYIQTNAAVRNGLTAQGLAHAFGLDQTYGYWHPLTLLSFMLDVELFGVKAGAMVLENALWHAVAAVFLFLALARATDRPWPSLLAAALFAVHPLHVEAVAWVVERKSALSGALAMLTVYLYVRHAEQPGWRRMAPTALVFALAVMAKAAVVALPGALLALDLWPLGRVLPPAGARTWREAARSMAAALPGLVREKLPLFALSLAGVLMALLSRTDVSLSRSAGSMYSLGLRLANIPVSLVGYWEKFLMPWDLTLYYPFPRDIPAWQWAGALLVALAVLAGLVRTARSRPCFLAGMLFFLAMFAPVSGLVQTGLWPALADRFSYLPNVGLCIMASWGLLLLAERGGTGGRRRAVAALAAVLVAYFGFLAWAQVGLWQNGVTLFAHAVRIFPQDRVIRANYAAALSSAGFASEAVVNMREAARLDPGIPDAYDWGRMLLELGQADEALALAREGWSRFPDKPAFVFGMAKAYEAKGDLDQALAWYRRLDLGDPKAADYAFAYASALDRAGRPREAVEVYEKFLGSGMRIGAVYARAGMANLEVGNRQRAGELFALALEREPDLTLAMRGQARLAREQGDLARAKALEAQADALDRRDAEAFFQVGEEMRRQGRPEDAGIQYREALRICPQLHEARARLQELGLPLSAGAAS